ncbi:hypothetical protein SCACP_14010 [Sporomusa carbonis]|uniref:sugar diacid recognition domain-containing protein n=1 Tax=Sporomusa carbonis TaxID=3076075 RepID=UPI003A7375CE
MELDPQFARSLVDIVTAEEELKLKGVRQGFNVPIVFGDSCVGVIGVSGDPDTAAPYARLAAKFVEAALESNARQEKLVRALKEKEEGRCPSSCCTTQTGSFG